MVSLTLEEVQPIIEKYLPKFDNNVSKFLRTTVIYYDEHQNEQQHKQNTLSLFSYFVFILLGTSLILLSLNYIIDIFNVLIPIILMISGVFLIIFMMFLLYTHRNIKKLLVRI